MIDLHFPTKPSGTPVLSKKEMDAIAERIMADYNPDALKTPQAIDVDDFAQNYLGMGQDFQYLSHCGVYLGMTVFNDTDEVPVYNPEKREAEYISARAGTIIIDNSLLDEKKEHRYRFTMGHEAAGHYVLHKQYFSHDPNQLAIEGWRDGPLVQCRTDMNKVQRNHNCFWNDRMWMEWQANVMSSCFMMPRLAVLKVVSDIQHRNTSLQDNRFALAYLAIKEVSSTFNMSGEASFYRLKELGLIPKGLSFNIAALDFIDVLEDEAEQQYLLVQ